MTGATFGPPHAPYLLERVRDRLLVTETAPGVFCWVWQGARHGRGYGLTTLGGRTRMTHRVVWAAAGRPLTPGRVLDHICHDPNVCRGGDECPHRPCANPWHLAEIDPAVNTSASRSALHSSWRDGRCANGHDLTADRAVYTAPSGRRRCRACANARQARYRAGAA